MTRSWWVLLVVFMGLARGLGVSCSWSWWVLLVVLVGIARGLARGLRWFCLWVGGLGLVVLLVVVVIMP
jgi:hypothetical protein